MQRLFLFFIIFLAFPFVHGCGDHLLQNSDIQTCEFFNDTHTTCSVKTSALIAMPPSTKTCLKLIYNNTVIGTFNITMNYIRVTTTWRTMYYTSGWQSENCYYNRCNLYTCNRPNEYQGCSNFYGYLDKNPCGLLTENCQNYPGITLCKSYYSGHCVGQANGFNRLSFRPIDPFMTVNENTGQIRTIHGKIESNIYGTQKEYDIQTLTDYDDEDYNFKIIGSFVDQTTDFNTVRLIITNNNKYYLTTTCLTGQPKGGNIGDIQSSYNLNIQFPQGNNYSFNFDNNIIVTYNPSDDGPGITAKQSGAQLLNYIQNPLLYNGIQWHEYGNSIYTDLTRSNNILINLQFKRSIKIIQNNNIICPNLIIQNIDGCHTCTGGFEFDVEYFTTCNVGSCTLISPDMIIANNVLIMEKYLKKEKIRAITSFKNLKTYLIVQCGSKFINLTLEAILRDETTLLPTIEPTYINPPPNQPTPVENEFNLEFYLPIILGTSIGGLILIIIITIIIIIIIKCVPKK